MDWIKVDTRLTGNRDFAVAKNADVGCWIRLLVYCAQQENLGRIKNARSLDAETWPHVARVSVAEVAQAVAAKLAWWEGDDLRVAWYDVDGQRRCESNRKVAASGGKKSGESRRSNQSLQATVQATVGASVEHGRTNGQTDEHGTWVLCDFHQHGRNQNARASKPRKDCPECKHAAALRVKRNGGTKPIAALLPPALSASPKVTP